MPQEKSRTFRPVTYIDSRKKAFLDLDKAVKQSTETPAALDSEFNPDKSLVVWSYSHGRGERKVVEGEFATSVYADWMAEKKFKKVYSFFKADSRIFKNLEIDLKKSFHADIVQLDWLVDENVKKHGLKDQVRRHLHRRRKDWKELFSYVPHGKKKSIQLNASQVFGFEPLPDGALSKMSAEDWVQTAREYSGDDAEDTIQLYWKHRKEIEVIGYWPNYLRIDRPFTHTLMSCESRGILIDVPGMKAIRVMAWSDMMRAEHAFKSLVEKPDLNLSSKAQVRNLLVHELDWPEFEDMRTEKTAEQQITKASLQRWRKEGYVLADLLLRRENKIKLKKDVTSLLEGISSDGRLRTDLNQVGASTGRVSSRKWKEKVLVEKVSRKGEVSRIEKTVQMGANLLNVVGKGEKDPYGVRSRFVAPRKGQVTADGSLAKEDHKIICVDEAGFELVMAIEWAGRVFEGSKLLEVMLEYGSPSAAHAYTAIHILGVPLTMKDWKRIKDEFGDQYKLAKILNFGLIYGGDEYTLCNKRGLDTRVKKNLDDNRKVKDRFFAGYPELVALQRWAIKHGYEHGWVPTISGRRQHVAEGLASFEKYVKKHWENKCTNGIVQGSCADVLKVAMNSIEADEEMRASGFRMLVQVYDEIVAESPASTANENMIKVVKYMEAPFASQMKVKLVAEGKVASDWMAAK